MTHKNCRTIKRQFCRQIFAFLTIPPAIMLLYLKVHNLNDINYTTSSLSIQQYKLALFVKHFLQFSFHRNTQLREHRVSNTVSSSTPYPAPTKTRAPKRNVTLFLGGYNTIQNRKSPPIGPHDTGPSCSARSIQLNSV